jgi:hypothetical protein
MVEISEKIRAEVGIGVTPADDAVDLTAQVEEPADAEA